MKELFPHLSSFSNKIALAQFQLKFKWGVLLLNQTLFLVLLTQIEQKFLRFGRIWVIECVSIFSEQTVLSRPNKGNIHFSDLFLSKIIILNQVKRGSFPWLYIFNRNNYLHDVLNRLLAFIAKKRYQSQPTKLVWNFGTNYALITIWYKSIVHITLKVSIARKNRFASKINLKFAGTNRVDHRLEDQIAYQNNALGEK